MAIFKCKMCGGDLEIAESASIAICEYCGAKQTVPKALDENLQSSFNRANTLRIKSEFDKAEKIYERIIEADPEQADAYWGLILCKYGIEYVDDPKTLKKIPTCHRASYDSIIADDDYKSAIERADANQRVVYEEQAREIDRIQKEILALAQKEETYDVFICYKETDSNGKRTQDSVIANDIYYQLKNEGFKVFYAAITLEGKLGSAYEPIIFAALNSAKVMLVIGTNPDYFNAVWVKNEWSRFLKIIQKDRSKLLIPCYRDMDAYELPEEFAHLQAQDMSKIGFINDIVRGIKKVVNKPANKGETSKAIESPKAQNNSFDALIKRIYLLLEDGDFNKADELCEQVLNGEPENAEAYICELLIEFKCHTKDELSSVRQNITNSKNYNKIIRFGNNEQIAYVKSANDKIQVVLQKIREEEERKKEEERQRAEELKRKQEEKRKRAEKRNKLVNDKTAIINNINVLEETQHTLNQKYIKSQSIYDVAHGSNIKLKRYAKIIFILGLILIVVLLLFLMTSVDIMYDLAIVMVVTYFFTMMICTRFMLKINGRSLWWLLLSYFTMGISSFIYACVCLFKNKNTTLEQCECEMNFAYSELQQINNKIDHAKHELNIAEKKLHDFDRTNKD